ncbi:MAG: HAMP domain-containing sensor histidine kinase [Clostridia bacterium]|nr:HAMP domain-containing sensor histidine kinase [Clostridia bacterium]
MSVKRKLFWSNLLIFALPVTVYLVATYLGDAIVWDYLTRQTFYSLDHFRTAVRDVQQTYRVITVALVVVTFLIANYALSRGILKRIENSLAQLSEGLRQLRTGNRAYRVAEDADDEFVNVRSDFNSMASQLQSSVEQVEQNEKNRQELIAGISHDLRSPLTSIRAYAEGLLDGVPQTEEDKRQYLTTIRDKTADLQSLVNTLFLFSRVDMGYNADKPELIDIGRELRELCAAISQEYEEKGLSVTCSAECACEVFMDPDTLHRIVMNIVENSYKYKTGAHGRLDIALTEEREYVSMAFRDDGPGVPAEALPRLFEAFYRSDPSRNGKTSGSGLGLAIVARAVRNMGGVIIARNLAPHGLEIEVQLPKQEGRNVAHIDS